MANYALVYLYHEVYPIMFTVALPRSVVMQIDALELKDAKI